MTEHDIDWMLNPPPNNVARVEAAVLHLRAARDLLKEAGAPKTTARVRAALSSAYGARRHAESEPYRAEPSA